MIDNINALPEVVRIVSNEVHPVGIHDVLGVLNQDIGLENPFGNLPPNEQPSESAVLLIRRYIREFGIKLNTEMPERAANEYTGFTIGVLLPETPKQIRDTFTDSLIRAAGSSDIPVKLVFRYYPPHFGEDDRFFTDDFYNLLNSMSRDKPDIYIVYPIRHNRFRECAQAITQRKPLILLDGIIMNCDFAVLKDAAYVGPDYYNTAVLASMAVSERIGDSDFTAIVTPHLSDNYDIVEKIPLTEGYIDMLRSLRRSKDTDIAIFHSGYGIYNTPAHLAMTVGSYYLSKRDKLNEKALAPDCKVKGVGVILTHEGTLRLTLDALRRMSSANDKVLSCAFCVGVNEDPDAIPQDLRKRITLLVNHDRDDEARKALTVAANRIHNGTFDTNGNLAAFTNCRILKF